MVKPVKGQIVTVAYTGKLDDGTVFDSSEGREPLSFPVGEGKIIKGFEETVVSMEVGEEKDIVLEPDQAYGPHRPELIQEVPKASLGELEVKEGMVLAMQAPGLDQPLPATVVKVAEESITVDVNPPLAGKTLHFHLKLEKIEDASAAEKPAEQPIKDAKKGA